LGRLVKDKQILRLEDIYLLSPHQRVSNHRPFLNTKR
jgi:hypothetical protein